MNQKLWLVIIGIAIGYSAGLVWLYSRFDGKGDIAGETSEITAVASLGYCGDGVANIGEDCDGSDLNGKNCNQVAGYNGGTLRCDYSCGFETASCTFTVPTSTPTPSVVQTSTTGSPTSPPTPTPTLAPTSTPTIRPTPALSPTTALLSLNQTDEQTIVPTTVIMPTPTEKKISDEEIKKIEKKEEPIVSKIVKEVPVEIKKNPIVLSLALLPVLIKKIAPMIIVLFRWLIRLR